MTKDLRNGERRGERGGREAREGGLEGGGVERKEAEEWRSGGAEERRSGGAEERRSGEAEKRRRRKSGGAEGKRRGGRGWRNEYLGTIHSLPNKSIVRKFVDQIPRKLLRQKIFHSRSYRWKNKFRGINKLKINTIAGFQCGKRTILNLAFFFLFAGYL
jgi:hypothetical protein